MFEPPRRTVRVRPQAIPSRRLENSAESIWAIQLEILPGRASHIRPGFICRAGAGLRLHAQRTVISGCGGGPNSAQRLVTRDRDRGCCKPSGYRDHDL
jgi:hypothetical protein